MSLTRENILELLSKPYDLRSLNLSGLDLSDIDFKKANLTRADLTRANLTRADLTRANLTDADLTDADLRYNLNNNSALLGTTIRGFYYPLFFHPKSNVISIGCKTYRFEEWMGFDDEEICKMDENALSFWKENKKKVKDLFEILKGEGR